MWGQATTKLTAVFSSLPEPTASAGSGRDARCGLKVESKRA